MRGEGKGGGGEDRGAWSVRYIKQGAISNIMCVDGNEIEIFN